MSKQIIKRLSGGWYSFKGINQKGNYIKVDCLKCNDDKTALKQAKRLLPGHEHPTIEIKGETEAEQVKRLGRF